MCGAGDTTEGGFPWTEEEKQAVLDVRQALVTKKDIDPSSLKEIELIYITIVSKCRVEKAVENFMTLRKYLEMFEITDLFADQSELAPEWYCYDVAGKDKCGRQILWIAGSNGTPVENETIHMRASVLYMMACYADLYTLRNGVTMAMAFGDRKKVKYGNEKKLGVVYQSLPHRPQAIYITSNSTLSRLAINATIKVVSVVARTKAKILSRIQFMTDQQLEGMFDKEALPDRLGGNKTMPTGEWVKDRLENFPMMDLPAF
jgi:hypothetical protein